jgi:transcriptional regulator with XRE-family HTH domain
VTKRKSEEEYRRELGLKLKALRNEAGLSGPQLARRLGVSQSKVSKIENGRTTPTVDDVVQFAEALDATSAVRDDLVSHIRDLVTETKGWQGRFQGGIRHRSRQMAEVEISSSQIRNFQQAVVPGLLQVPQYARRLFEMEPLAVEPSQIPGAVSARMDRQSVLYDEEKSVTFVIAEPALRYSYVDRRVMAAQIDRLLVMSELENVEVCILSFDRSIDFIPFCSFTIYDDSMVLAETYSNSLRIHDPDDVAVYEQAFDIAYENAAKGAKATKFLRNLRSELIST